MQKISKNIIWKNLALLLAFGLIQLPLVATAQAPNKTPPADLQPLEDIPPPAISNEENADEPQITIVKKKGETIEEYRVNGQLYMMKITPAHGVPYYLHKEDQDGSWVNTGPTPPLSIPKWTIFRF
ncbi:DUF2782 domain-containing protein [Methylotenera sp.]|uniref:DUF2782 domain-containing protein n=1 Tax=Methylotenera sp. TaxID=2051956 RepID=UPI0027196FD3|nr:DUF2782 domain-containing protein [Methylotenera sp.]MDO9204265.1 DUF2782 domain-containing protein [Methylotenera sp.]MDO9394585.1 DUF2782 domain-containing protein [Methylotenera sp.]MDP1523159.1 DUF2782 domain-containing protein [Methylotenera sp.]MDP2070104.1 DUF2782 domain-containing protein [Methylotenera sp.]MDP2229973.1 DUF2782 domain-containing protein [Methylotenera sp.]